MLICSLIEVPIVSCQSNLRQLKVTNDHGIFYYAFIGLLFLLFVWNRAIMTLIKLIQTILNNARLKAMYFVAF